MELEFFDIETVAWKGGHERGYAKTMQFDSSGVNISFEVGRRRMGHPELAVVFWKCDCRSGICCGGAY